MSASPYPKIELHVHLEATVRPERLLELGRRNDVRLPARTAAGLERFCRFSGFDRFIAVWVKTTSVLRHGRDFREIVVDYAAELAAQGCVYAEPLFSPSEPVIARRVVGRRSSRGTATAPRRRASGTAWSFASRRTSRATSRRRSASELAEWAVRFRDRGVAGISLGGSEHRFPPAPFARAFAIAREGGLKAAPHAGETAGPASIRSALDDLHADRLRHGVRAVEDPALLAELAERGVVCDVTPVSNLRTGVVKSLDEHPLPAMLAAGVKCSIGSDDPVLMQTSLTEDCRGRRPPGPHAAGHVRARGRRRVLRRADARPPQGRGRRLRLGSACRYVESAHGVTPAESASRRNGHRRETSPPPEVALRARRLGTVMVLLSLAYAVAAFLLPLEVVEILGAPLVVARRLLPRTARGLPRRALGDPRRHDRLPQHPPGRSRATTSSPWPATSSSALLVGLAVDRFARQKRHLEEAVEEAGLARKQFAASEGAVPSALRAQRRPRVPARPRPRRRAHAVPRRQRRDLCPARLHARGASRTDAARDRRGAGARPAAADDGASCCATARCTTRACAAARDGELIPVEISSSLTEVEGELVVLSISRDIRERQREVRRLQELTLRDELTGLLNRRGLDVMLPEQAKRAKRSGRPVIVVYGDVDRFKTLNDTYGHERGDEVLVAVPGALQSAFRETDLIARLGGDEFCVVAEADDIDPARLGERLDATVKLAGERARHGDRPQSRRGDDRLAGAGGCSQRCWPRPTRACTRPSTRAATDCGPALWARAWRRALEGRMQTC